MTYIIIKAALEAAISDLSFSARKRERRTRPALLRGISARFVESLEALPPLSIPLFLFFSLFFFFFFFPRQPTQSRRSPERKRHLRFELRFYDLFPIIGTRVRDISLISRPRRISAFLVSRVCRLHISSISISLRVFPVAVSSMLILQIGPKPSCHFPATSIEVVLLSYPLPFFFSSFSVSFPLFIYFTVYVRAYISGLFPILPAKLMVMT